MKVLSVFPLIGAGQDCSNNGLVYRKWKENRLSGIMDLIMGTPEEIEEWAQKQTPEKLQETLVVEQRILWGEPHWYARPLVKPKGVETFGGNYVVASDSRFKEFTGIGRGLPIPVHDRYDSMQDYLKMCV